jgi:ABC-type sugar transport system ATPase subunit
MADTQGAGGLVPPAPPGDGTAPVVELRGIVKRFGAFTALDRVDLAVGAGEVVGLLGENGAGKSTLIKVLSGAHHADEGQILVDGRVAEVRSPADAIAAGIATVYQHSMLAQNLTVAENLVLGREPGVPHARWLVAGGAVRRAAQEICARFDVELPLGARVGDLSLAARQRVEILRAAANAGRLVVLDEPTAALEPHEVDGLFRLVRGLTAAGLGVVYVTHRLDEVPVICDRVVALRDGRRVGELDKEHAVPAEIIPLLVGREVDQLFPELPSPAERVQVEITDLRTAGAGAFSVTLRAGEVVGLTGAAGSGQREVARAVFGAQASTGTVTVAGRSVPRGRPDHAVRAGVGYVSGDRAKDGLIPQLSVWRNAVLAATRRLSRPAGIVHVRAERAMGLRLVETFDVRCSNPRQAISTLSGGNQQKALIARWAPLEPRLLILDEPTLGVDVGARREIYDQVAALVAQGMSVLLVSADFAELRGLSHRVLVFNDGDVVAEMPAEVATESAVLHARTNARTRADRGGEPR